jgi:hypothetical protein
LVKIDYKLQLKALYKPPKGRLLIIEVPRMRYLMVDGKGDPDSSDEWRNGMSALYGVGYSIKFLMKKAKLDYVMPPLEALWRADDMSSFTSMEKDSWKWTAMIMQPEAVTAEIFEEALQRTKEKVEPNPALEKVRLDDFEEGLCAQVLHVGPFSDEAPTVERLHAYIEENGYALRGAHHEIYLTDPRRIKPERWRTVIRQPIERAE